MTAPTLMHGTCLTIDTKGVLLTGPSGIGKSDLALRLIRQGARLVADDQVHVLWDCEHVIARPPETLRGLLEIYGIGIVRLPEDKLCAQAPLSLVVDLLPHDTAPERMPEPDNMMLLDHPVRRIRLGALHPSTPAKIFTALCCPLVEQTLSPAST
ncbi:MAG: serine/threonine protein kinase [Alphaproteobacteria bacterium]|nr:serine/threonine protein kinase [Alphaproteobacteria bacterium]